MWREETFQEDNVEWLTQTVKQISAHYVSSRHEDDHLLLCRAVNSLKSLIPPHRPEKRLKSTDSRINPSLYYSILDPVGNRLARAGKYPILVLGHLEKAKEWVPPEGFNLISVKSDKLITGQILSREGLEALEGDPQLSHLSNSQPVFSADI